jgi:amino-acid N-acetyltransferase
VIRAAAPDDREAAEALLAAAALPLAGFSDHLGTTLLADGGGAVVGCVALELYGADALLRSLAVSAPWRDRGVGRALVTAAIELAAGRGARRLWLLTTTADRYFPRYGFSVVDRSAIAPAMGASAELRGACPATAVAMKLDLDA